MNQYKILVKGDQVAAVEIDTPDSEGMIKALKSRRFIGQRELIEAENREKAIEKYCDNIQKELKPHDGITDTTGYQTGKTVYSFIEGFGWFLIIIGAIFTFAFLMQLSTSYSVSLLDVISRVIPGIGVAMGGLFTIAMAQVMKATIATAENSQKILEELTQKRG